MNRGERMKLRIVALAISLALTGVLAACSGEAPFDPDAVEAKLTTNPEAVTVGGAVKLTTEFEGMDVGDDATVNFDIRGGEEPVLIDAVSEGGGVYSGSYTFPEKGIITVYIHL